MLEFIQGLESMREKRQGIQLARKRKDQELMRLLQQPAAQLRHEKEKAFKFLKFLFG